MKLITEMTYVLFLYSIITFTIIFYNRSNWNYLILIPLITIFSTPSNKYKEDSDKN